MWQNLMSQRLDGGDDTTLGLHLQDPTAAGWTLLDALALAGKQAQRGGGIFAFASARGVRTLLGDGGPVTDVAAFELIVGIDAITDDRALDAIDEHVASRSGLAARVLVHNGPTLFHPKLSWFVSGTTLTLIVGSGNLTPGGLSSNHEAFFVSQLTGNAARAVEDQLNGWRTSYTQQLRATDDPEVRKLAQANSGAERSLRKRMSVENEEPNGAAPPPASATALVLEISRNNEGRMQLDVGQDQFRRFFGGVVGADKRILIQHVDGTGTIRSVETPRTLFKTKSDNYRFEAGARRDMTHPPAGRPRPVGLFVRMPDGTFRYMLIWPGEPGYTQTMAYLEQQIPKPGAKMRRKITTAAAVKAAWPSCPLV